MWLKDRIEEYKDYVKQNPRKVKRIEEIARMGTMIFPVSKLGAYSEVINEGMYSILGNVSAINDHFIHQQNDAPKWNTNFKLYLLVKLRMFLTFLSHTEVVSEMYLRQFVSNRLCRKFITIIEWFKVFARLILLFTIRNSRKNPMLFSNGQYIASSASNSPPPITKSSDIQEIKEQPAIWVGKRTGKKFVLPDSLRHKSNVENTLTDDNNVDVVSLPNEAKADRYLSIGAEVLNILRPLITLYSNSWKAWFLSFFADMLSFRLIFLANLCKSKKRNQKTKDYIVQKLKGQNIDYNLVNIGPEVRTEMLRRTMLLMLYLMRSPFYDRYTLSLAINIQNKIKSLPLASKLGNFLEDTLNYYHRAHFYISGS